MDLSKLDDELAARYARYRRAVERGEDSGSPGDLRVHVSLIFHGDVARLEAAGLSQTTVYGTVAYGAVRMADLERLTELSEVERIALQARAHPMLDASVPEAQVPALWTGSPAYRGAGVVVGVVDSGIDVFHHNFRKPDGTTRILFLWDQTDDRAPHPPGFTYGRHYTAGEIDAALSSGSFDQLDSNGHGTHVAGTAAGDGSQSGNCHLGNHYVGVAPDADLIIVKSEFREQTYVDGVQYIFARAGASAAVANLSLGSSSASHDGTGAGEIALDAILQPKPDGRAVVVSNGNSADDGLHAHKSVGASGNATMKFTVLARDRFYVAGYVWYGSSGPIGGGGPGASARLRVTLKAPDGSSRDIAPGEPSLVDEAFAGGQLDFFASLHVGRMHRHRTWFKLTPPPHGALMAGDWEIALEEIAGTATDVDCWLGPYHRWRVEENIPANGKKELTFNVTGSVTGTDSCRITYSGDARLSIKVTKPDPDSTPVVGANDGSVSHDAGDDHTVRFNCRTDTPSAGQHLLQFWIRAREAGKAVARGAWGITLEETAGHATDYEAVFAQERPWATVRKSDGTRVTRINRPTFIEADQEPSRTVESPAAAQNVIAVGAYDPRDGALADFSSRGPTVDGRQKPDLCAPGVAITAPRTRVKNSPCVSDCCEDFYTDMQGTSMAAPHVTGVVALMLQRNKTLDYEAIRDALRDNVVAVPGGDPNDWGEGKLDAEAAVMSVAASGGGGGGGGGGSIRSADADDGVFLPTRASWPLYLPTAERLQALFDTLAATPTGRLVAALLSRHFDEVKAIVNGSRRAAVAWHRMRGPELLRIALSWSGESRPIIPARLDDVPVSGGLERLLQVVATAASPALLADIERYRSFVLALPGARLRDLEAAADLVSGR